MSEHDEFMEQCIELASGGLGFVSPNPMVGCIIVHEGRVIGSGYHESFGQPHAEVMALESVSDSDRIFLQDSTLYVNLEPCVHTGKTPPCCDRIIQEGVKRVVVGCQDVNVQVCGKGVKKLLEADVEVVEGILESDCRFLNRRFEVFQTHKRPYIILKWAQTDDGFIARSNYESKWISGENSRALVHRWRSEESAILVGTKTAEVDNPRLNVRLDEFGITTPQPPKPPLRVVLDRNLHLSSELHLFDGSQPTLVISESPEKPLRNVDYARIQSGDAFIADLLKALFEREISSLIVEGGAKTLAEFIRQGLWDEARIFRSPECFTKGISAPAMTGTPYSVYPVGKDLLEVFYRSEIAELLKKGSLPVSSPKI